MSMLKQSVTNTAKRRIKMQALKNETAQLNNANLRVVSISETNNADTQQTCRCFELGVTAAEPQNITKTVKKKKKRSTSMTTSRGVKKAQEDEPIRTLEHIHQAQEYFLTTGRTRWHRLRNYMIFILGISTGLRGSDLLKLKIGDVLYENGTVRSHFRTIEKKTRKTNLPMINAAAKEAIENYLGCLETIDLNEYLILSERKGQMTPVQLYRILHKLNTDLGFEEHIGAHSMRKTFAYWNLKMHPNDNNALAVIQQMMNHSSSQTTLRYCGITKEDKDVFYTDIGSIFNTGK